MLKKGVGVFGLLAVGAVMVFVIGGVPRSKVKTGSLPKIQTVGLPEYGVAIVGPTEATFESLISKRMQETTGENASSLKSSSVFVVNNSAKSIAALSLKWELLQADGQVIVHHRGHRSTLRVVSDAGPAQLEQDVAPNNYRLVSLLSNGSIGGLRVNTGGGGVDKRRQLAESVIVTISVDSVLFEDGTFVGPDTRNSFEDLKAELEARIEVYSEIVRALNGDSDAIRHIEALAREDRKGTQTLSGKVDLSSQDNWVKGDIAGMTLAMRKELGDKAILKRLNAELSKPRINLRKL